MWKARRSVRLPSNCDEQQRKAVLLRPGPNQLLKLDTATKTTDFFSGNLSLLFEDYSLQLVKTELHSELNQLNFDITNRQSFSSNQGKLIQ